MFLVTSPEALENAAAEVRNMSAEMVAADAGAAPVITAVVAPAPDPDSERAAEYLVRHAQQFSEVFAEATEIFEKFALALGAGADKYAATEADSVKALS